MTAKVSHVVPERGHLKPGMFVAGATATTDRRRSVLYVRHRATEMAGVLATGEIR
jgi:hypothetical protein